MTDSGLVRLYLAMCDEHAAAIRARFRAWLDGPRATKYSESVPTDDFLRSQCTITGLVEAMEVASKSGRVGPAVDAMREHLGAVVGYPRHADERACETRRWDESRAEMRRIAGVA